ncbi:MAG: hypothetical protein AcusKO_34390 [Acuticoccus sp.]
MAEIVMAHTATRLAHAKGRVVVCGSHGGAYVGLLAAAAGVRAIVVNDAGVGLEAAGVGSLSVCDAHGIAAAAASHASCRIGNAEDTMARGTVSAVNRLATARGVTPGMSVREAATRLTKARAPRPAPKHGGDEHRSETMVGAVRVLILDSNGLVRPGEDDGAVIVTGSHGGLVGDDPASAGRAEARLFAFNDAGVGADEAGISRLPVLDTRHIPAVCVDCFTARIGDGQSTYEDGVISHTNDTARRLGARTGTELRSFVASFAVA